MPTLETDGHDLVQSLAIIEYLEEIKPQPPLLPADPLARAQARAIALAIACDIHPLNNLRVRAYLHDRLRIDDAGRTAWYRHWVEHGLAAVEAMVLRGGGGHPFSVGDRPTLADICLVPQMANARRFDCDVGGCLTLLAIDAACRALPAFVGAAPENQPDAEKPTSP